MTTRQLNAHLPAELKQKLAHLITLNHANLFLQTDYPLKMLAGVNSGFNRDYANWWAKPLVIAGKMKQQWDSRCNLNFKLDFYRAKTFVRTNYKNEAFDALILEAINKIVLDHYRIDETNGGYCGVRDVPLTVPRLGKLPYFTRSPDDIPEALADEMEDYYSAEDDEFLKLLACFKFYLQAEVMYFYNAGNSRTNRLALEFLLLKNGVNLPLFYDLEASFVQNEKALNEATWQMIDEYCEGKEVYGLDLLDGLVDLFLAKYEELAKNYNLAVTEKLDLKNKDDVMAYFFTVNQTFSFTQLNQYLYDSGLTAPKLNDEVNRLVKKGYLLVEGRNYRTKAGMDYAKWHKAVKTRRWKWHF